MVLFLHLLLKFARKMFILHFFVATLLQKWHFSMKSTVKSPMGGQFFKIYHPMRHSLSSSPPEWIWEKLTLWYVGKKSLYGEVKPTYIISILNKKLSLFVMNFKALSKNFLRKQKVPNPWKYKLVYFLILLTFPLGSETVSLISILRIK